MDLTTVEALGVEWRESSFLHNRKLSFGPEASVSQAVIGPGRVTMRRQSQGDAAPSAAEAIQVTI